MAGNEGDVDSLREESLVSSAKYALVGNTSKTSKENCNCMEPFLCWLKHVFELISEQFR